MANQSSTLGLISASPGSSSTLAIWLWGSLNLINANILSTTNANILSTTNADIQNTTTLPVESGKLLWNNLNNWLNSKSSYPSVAPNMLLMTVGGSKTLPNTKQFVKLYSLNGDIPVPTCLQNHLTKLPDNRQYSAGATLGTGLLWAVSQLKKFYKIVYKYNWIDWQLEDCNHLYVYCFICKDGIPYICGGAQRNNNKNCLRYNPSDDSWVKSGDLKYEHYRSGYTSHSTLGLVMCGQERNFDAEKCETTLDGSVMQALAESSINFTIGLTAFMVNF